MSPKEIKKGEFVKLKLLVIDKLCHRLTLEAPSGKKLIVWSDDFEALSPANGTKNAEPAPKYDTCRKFRKGDIVRVVEWNCRDIARVGQIGYVVSDECNSRVELSIDGWTKDVYYPACHLELVTPVEELDPYIMLGNAPSNSIEVRDKRTNKVEATFYFGKDHAYTLEQATTRAEAERDRLNTEYRKEQNNDH